MVITGEWWLETSCKPDILLANDMTAVVYVYAKPVEVEKLDGECFTFIFSANLKIEVNKINKPRLKLEKIES